jgi:hypothetical protein
MTAAPPPAILGGVESQLGCRTMTTIYDYHPRAAGLPWVRKEDYAAFLRICEDAHGLPTTWEKFIEFSEKAEKGFQTDGMIVERVYIDPETFPDWCRRNGVGVNSQGRMRFAGMAVAEKYGRNQG